MKLLTSIAGGRRTRSGGSSRHSIFAHLHMVDMEPVYIFSITRLTKKVGTNIGNYTFVCIESRRQDMSASQDSCAQVRERLREKQKVSCPSPPIHLPPHIPA